MKKLDFNERNDLQTQELRAIALEHGEKIESVDFSNSNLNTSLILVTFQHFFTLKELTLINCTSLRSTDFSIIATSCYRTLKKLNLAQNTGLKDESINAICGKVGSGFSSCNRIGHLILEGCQELTDDCLEAIGTTLRKLSYLSVQNCKRFTDLGISRVAIGCPHLRYLNLSGCFEIKGACLSFLEVNCKKLNELNLSGCTKITDDTLSCLVCPSNCMKLSTIHVLCLSGCFRITDESLTNILRHAFSLKSLNITGCTQISPSSIQTVVSRISHFKLSKRFQGIELKDTAVADRKIILQEKSEKVASIKIQSFIKKSFLIVKESKRKLSVKRKIASFHLQGFHKIVVAKKLLSKKAKDYEFRRKQMNNFSAEEERLFAIGLDKKALEDENRESSMLTLTKLQKMQRLKIKKTSGKNEKITEKLQLFQKYSSLVLLRTKCLTYKNWQMEYKIFYESQIQIIQKALRTRKKFKQNLLRHIFTEVRQYFLLKFMTLLVFFNNGSQLKFTMRVWNKVQEQENIKIKKSTIVAQQFIRRRFAVKTTNKLRKNRKQLELCVTTCQANFRRQKVMPWRKIKFEINMQKLVKRKQMESTKAAERSKLRGQRNKKANFRTGIDGKFIYDWRKEYDESSEGYIYYSPSRGETVIRTPRHNVRGRLLVGVCFRENDSREGGFISNYNPSKDEHELTYFNENIERLWKQLNKVNKDFEVYNYGSLDLKEGWQSLGWYAKR